ncbi:rhomboid family intramembrane serine protease [Lutibacter aestuarii]|uniref:Rhomboid family intramembrane serine protease n=1 Tax=Lutibacter aestuarii TaxID=861111 RepID=A0ABW2Z3D7_9FLAO|nr:rhomboid family intramembrane serine protease [uncultured Lutibacter sp.]
MSEHQFKYNSRVISIPLVVIVLIWLVYIFEIKFGYNFNKYGVYPKSIKGLRGIIFAPFIHSNIKHLASNTIPLAVMLGCLYYFYFKVANKVLILGMLISGFLTWLIARPSYHIGASGVIYLLVSFIFFSGIFRKYYRLIAVSLTVVFLYGSMVWYIFPVEERISWEGHLSGFLTGFVFAFIFKNIGPKPEKYQFTKDESFDSLFDEDGNYNPPIEEIDENA